MKTEELISELSQENKKTQPMCTWRCALSACMLSGLFLYIAINYIGMRTDLDSFLSRQICQIELYLAGITGVLSALAASWLSTPDHKQQRWVYWLPFVPLVGLAINLVWQFSLDMQQGAMEMNMNWTCTTQALLFISIPAIAFFFILKRAASTHVVWTAGMATLSVASFAYFALRLVCQVPHTGSAILWGVIPLLIVSIFLILLGSRFLRW